MDLAIEATGLRKRVRSHRRAGRPRSHRRRGHGLRAARPQRRRQDHHDRILTTLVRPDAGSARVAGFDLVHRADEVSSASRSPGSPPPSTTCSRRPRTSSCSAGSPDCHAPMRRPGPPICSALRAVAMPRPSCRHLLGRHAPTPRHRDELRRTCRASVPRRADDRPRHRAAAASCGRSSAGSPMPARRSS